MVRLIERMEGEKPLLVHSQMPNPEAKIKAFRNTDKRWLVSVAMVSDGVDIKRLRVLLYLPHALTELAFRQAVGRMTTRAPMWLCRPSTPSRRSRGGSKRRCPRPHARVRMRPAASGRLPSE